MRKDRRVRKEDYSRQRMVQRKIEKLAQINKEERVNCLKKEEMKQVNISKLNIPKARFGIIKNETKRLEAEKWANINANNYEENEVQ